MVHSLRKYGAVLLPHVSDTAPVNNHLVRQDSTTCTFRIPDGSRVTVPPGWVQAIVSTG